MPGLSPNPAANLIMANAIVRTGSILLRRAVDKRMLRGRYGKDTAEAAAENQGLGSTLTALALIFAVFLANPAPICVLDEVDAPLDDANVTRFCDMLDEMCRQTDTRFLIITHHAVTMARMDRLFGVTMQEKGVSQLVSVDLKKAEALVA